MTRMNTNALRAQAVQPGAQQRGGFHIFGEHAIGGADKGFDTQLMNPAAQIVRGEIIQHRPQPVAGAAITTDKIRVIFGVGNVHPTDTGEQEFSRHTRHGIKYLNGQPLAGYAFGGHQTGGTCTNNSNAR